ncbi:MAG: hypothetical protein IJ608_12270 [Lachnospiraceae bacterium]|nr:hypothetical protein [Lachnospiraceae bacterium]
MAKKRVVSIQSKLLAVILPLFLISFVITTVLIYTNACEIILTNAESNIKTESDSNLKTMVNDLIVQIPTESVEESYKKLSLKPATKNYIYSMVHDIIFMEEGRAILVDTRSLLVLSHSEEEYQNRKLSDADIGGFYNRIGELVNSGNTDVNELSNNGEVYYVVISYMEGAPWALVSYIPKSHITKDLQSLLVFIAIIFVAVLLIVAVVTGLVIRKTLLPIKTLTNNITTISDGDFTIDVRSKGNDEISVMSSSLSDFVQIMREVIGDIRNVSDQLSESSGNTKNIATALNSAADSQATSMADVKQTLDQIAQGIQELAEHATTLSGVVTETNERGEEARASMKLTVEVAAGGKNDMQEVGRTMTSIVDSMKSLQDMVIQVSKSTESINSMVEMITDISDQTNLLSLNASIEAARAGDAGRGFAVVAEEIRRLAETSADSAAQIGEIIGKVNEDVQTMVKKTDESVQYIESNSEKITESSKVFEKIYNDVSEANEMVGGIVDQINQVENVATNIAALSEEQSANTAEILASTEDLTDNTVQFSNDSQTVASSADEVSSAAFTLAEHMRRFKV